MATRAIIVDDSSDRINYEGGSWFEDHGSRDQVGNFGPPFRSTLHGTQASASFSFSFSGTSVKVFGANNLRNDSGVLDPTWECFVDDISIGATTPFQEPENNWPFCEQPQLADGHHTLAVNATVTMKQTFWFDCIHYTPSPTATTEQQLVFVDNRDPELKYGSGWGALGGTANMTNKKGTTFEFEFTGVSLSWFSFIPEELPGKSTTGTYTVDGGSPQNFNLKGHGDNALTVYHQKFFETPPLPTGRHKLVVVYNGNGNTTPLTVEYLIIQNGTASSSNPTPTNTHANVAVKKETNIDAIVGGVVSASAVIMFFLLAFFFIWRRKQRQETKKHSEDSEVHPFQYQPAQYAISPTPSAPRGYTSRDAFDTQSVQYSNSVGQYLSNLSDRNKGNLFPSFASPPAVPRPIISSEAPGAMFQRGSLDVALRRVIRHEDSGMRMQDDNPEEVIELPPQYTIG